MGGQSGGLDAASGAFKRHEREGRGGGAAIQARREAEPEVIDRERTAAVGGPGPARRRREVRPAPTGSSAAPAPANRALHQTRGKKESRSEESHPSPQGTGQRHLLLTPPAPGVQQT